MDYYEIYLSKHQQVGTRRLHFLGQVLTLLYIIYIVMYCSWWWLLLAPFVIYPTAILGHIVYEKNRPAFLSINILKAKWADLRMCWDMIIGKLPF